jgi:solute carrier family 25 (mitochondrial 2-oxodicarboxylate transporter), member 21
MRRLLTEACSTASARSLHKKGKQPRKRGYVSIVQDLIPLMMRAKVAAALSGHRGTYSYGNSKKVRNFGRVKPTIPHHVFLSTSLSFPPHQLWHSSSVMVATLFDKQCFAKGGQPFFSNRATKFAANDGWSKFYARGLGTTEKTQGLATLTGASAGATEALVVVPFELVKIRLQDQSATGRYKSVLDCAMQITRQSGLLGLYQGFESTVWRHIVWNAGYFGCIYQVRSLIAVANTTTTTTREGTLVNDLVAGSVGGTVGTLLNTPLDVVKSRIQSGGPLHSGGCSQKVPWVWPGVLAIYRAEGIAALYKGLVPKLVRFAPGGGILLVVYTSVIDLLASV